MKSLIVSAYKTLPCGDSWVLLRSTFLFCTFYVPNWRFQKEFHTFWCIYLLTENVLIIDSKALWLHYVGIVPLEPELDGPLLLMTHLAQKQHTKVSCFCAKRGHKAKMDIASSGSKGTI